MPSGVLVGRRDAIGVSLRSVTAAIHLDRSDRGSNSLLKPLDRETDLRLLGLFHDGTSLEKRWKVPAARGPRTLCKQPPHHRQLANWKLWAICEGVANITEKYLLTACH